MIIFGVVITLLAVPIRFRVRGFCSADMEGYLLPWYDQIKAGGGLSMLKQQVGDYNILFDFPDGTAKFFFLGTKRFCLYFFAILTLYLLLRGKNKTAFIMFGIAIALYYLISLATFYLLALPGVIGRHSLLEPFRGPAFFFCLKCTKDTDIRRISC